MKKLTGIITCFVLLFITLSIADCSKNSSSVPPKEVSIKTSATLGKYLADKDGHTLYFFANDSKGQSSCTGSCETNWTVFRDSNLVASQIDDSLSLTDFVTITTSEGKKQLTFRGWPLYTYTPSGAQEGAGLFGGEGLFGLWFAAKPDYSVMLTNTQLIGKDGNHYKSDYTLGDGATTYFTDSKGLTLYVFKKDSANLNKFTKPDFSNNATCPIYDTAAIVVPSILDKTLFSITNVYGHHQLSYNGWPLYYYSLDSTTRGNNHGITIGGIGTIWPVAVKGIAAAPHH
jgi:predicted lipoprotein with Yx(FWY)xxD motif